MMDDALLYSLSHLQLRVQCPNVTLHKTLVEWMKQRWKSEMDDG